MSEILTRLEELVTPTLEAEQVELVDLTYQKTHSGWTLCFYLDKPGGITLDDCANWSDRLEALIESAAVIDRSYVLEVASPGLDRPLRKLQDFLRFAGERIHVRLYAGIDGQKNFHGVLLGADEENLKMKEDDGRELALPRTQVARCRLDPVIDFRSKRITVEESNGGN